MNLTKYSFLKNRNLPNLLGLALSVLAPMHRSSAQAAPLPVLESFIVEQSALEPIDSLRPSDQVVDSAFLRGMSLFETPRAVSVLSPELLDQFGIRDFNTLSRFGASTERVNFYGIAGAPMLRGWQGGIYYKGMLRPFQRNQMPTSFGALDAMEVIKGPAPAHLISSHVGGYVNMVPKAPYFDRFRGSAELEIGTNDHYRGQLDVGGPVLLLDEIPAAYRLSITGQKAGSYYDDVSNDFVSLYGSIKVQLGKSTFLTLGTEYYKFKSNENSGWNRPTQNLIDSGEYVIGEPLSLVRSDIGVADRARIDQITYGFGPIPAAQRARFRALVVDAETVDAAVISGQITPAQRAAMLDMSDPSTRATVYAGIPENIARTESGYLYTPEYFLNGGAVFTQPIKGSTVLSDANDFADSDDWLFFGEFDHRVSPDSRITVDLFVESMNTDKLSSYGYAFRSKFDLIDLRTQMEHSFEGESLSFVLNYGGQVRYSEALQLQDFWTEPFARRDITQPEISPNSVILAGAQVDPATGNNFWAGGFGEPGPAGHAAQSELLQTGVFALGNLGVGSRLNLLGSLRYDHFSIEVSVPEGPTDMQANQTESDGSRLSWSINPVLTLTDWLNVYAVSQRSMTFAPGDGGVVLSEANFGVGTLQEIGAKVQALDGRLFANLSLYRWEQSSFNDRTSLSDSYQSEGIEFEVNYEISRQLTLIGSASWRETRRLSDLGFRTMPFGLADPTGAGDAERGIALNGGALLPQFAEALGGFTPEGARPANNPDLIAPGAPEASFKFFAVYENFWLDGLGISGGFVYTDSYWQNYDRTLRLPEATVFNMNLYYRQPSWEIKLSIDNLTDADAFLGAEPTFAANTLTTKAPGREARLSFKLLF